MIGCGIIPSEGGLNSLFYPTNGLELRLRSDRGIITVGGGLDDGEIITTWEDTSEFGRDASQPTTAKKPEYKTNIVNGKPAIRFDGTDDFFSLPDLSVLFDGAISLFAVATSASGAIQYDTLIAHTASASPYKEIFMRNDGSKDIWEAQLIGTGGGNAVRGTDAVDDGVFRLLTLQTNTTNGITRFGVNGETYGFDLTPPSIDITGATKTRIGALNWTGNTEVNFLEGDIGAISGHSKELSTSERRRAETYYLRKYRL